MEDISVFIECAKNYHLIDTWLVGEAQKGQSYSCELFGVLPQHCGRQTCERPGCCGRQICPDKQDKPSSWHCFQSWLLLGHQNSGRVHL